MFIHAKWKWQCLFYYTFFLYLYLTYPTNLALDLINTWKFRIFFNVLHKQKQSHLFTYILDAINDSYYDFFLLQILAHTNAADIGYYGTKIGPLSQLHHGVSGDVYAVDSRTLFLKNFNYDGEGPGKDFIMILSFIVNILG